MPQLQKVALAVGNTLVYENTYEQALKALQAIQKGQPAAAPPPALETSATPTPAPSSVRAPAGADSRIAAIRAHIERYRELSAQGKWSEAGKELEAIEAEVKK